MFVNLPAAAKCGMCSEPRKEASPAPSEEEDVASEASKPEVDSSTVQSSVVAGTDGNEEEADDFAETASLVPAEIITNGASQAATQQSLAGMEEEEEEEPQPDDAPPPPPPPAASEPAATKPTLPASPVIIEEPVIESEKQPLIVTESEGEEWHDAAAEGMSAEDESFMEAFMDAAAADKAPLAAAASYDGGGASAEEGDEAMGSQQQPKRAVARFEVCSEQGRRPTMEDVYTVADSIHDEVDRAFFAVFDGHAGSRAAEYCGQRMLDNITSTAAWKRHDHATAVKFGIKRTEQAFLRAALSATPRWFDGTTVVTCLIANGTLTVGWVGDSRCVLGRHDGQTWSALPLSRDHKPSDPAELARIISCGGMVGRSLKEASAAGASRSLGAQCPAFCFGVHTANPVRCYPGGLSLSRSVGDVSLKYNPTKCVVGEPDLVERKLHPHDKFIILACDGIWDVLSDGKAVEVVVKALEQKMDGARALVRIAHTVGSTDNMTAIVVHLPE